ncbi:MAG: sulfite exporter TauE/SafE family protein [Acidobacteriota bacterium]|jgi:uncharacterized protein
MTIFLPVAGVSINVFLLIGVGAVVGFLSGVFGVGGGFLMTPILIMLGIEPMVAAASDANQIVAASTSGAFAHYKEGNVDVKMGGLMLLGGVVGGTLGTFLIKFLRQTGNVDVVIRICYVVLLALVGVIMLAESLSSRSAAARRLNRKESWLERVRIPMPLPTRFEVSGVTASAVSPVILGVIVGILAALMGVGGGFLLIPVMTYLLRMPMKIVVGTSLFQMLFTAGATTVMQAVVNHNVDIFLALALLVGSSIGAQVGAKAGKRLSGTQLKIFLALIVLALSVKMFISLLVRPAHILIQMGGH